MGGCFAECTLRPIQSWELLHWGLQPLPWGTRKGALLLRPQQQSLWDLSPLPVMPRRPSQSRSGDISFLFRPSHGSQYPSLQEAVGLVVESLWDTSGFEPYLCHLLAAGPWASCLTAPTLSWLICKMGMLSSCLLGLLRGLQRRAKHLAQTEHSGNGGYTVVAPGL